MFDLVGKKVWIIPISRDKWCFGVPGSYSLCTKQKITDCNTEDVSNKKHSFFIFLLQKVLLRCALMNTSQHSVCVCGCVLKQNTGCLLFHPGYSPELWTERAAEQHSRWVQLRPRTLHWAHKPLWSPTGGCGTCMMTCMMTHPPSLPHQHHQVYKIPLTCQRILDSRGFWILCMFPPNSRNLNRDFWENLGT